MSARIRILLVGCGRMGKKHLAKLREHPDFEVVGVADPVAPEATMHVYDPQPQYDAAIIATPTERHHEDVCYLRRDIPILIEKPLSIRPPDGDEIHFHDQVVVGHIERFNPAVRELKRRADDLRGLYSIQAIRRVADPGDGRNVVFDLAAHDIDVIRWIFGPVRIEEVDPVMGLIGFSLRDLRINYGTLVAQYSNLLERTLRIGTHTDTVRLDYAARTLVWKGEQVVTEQFDPLRAELDAFAHFIRTGERGDLCSADDGAAVVRLCEDASRPREYV